MAIDFTTPDVKNRTLSPAGHEKFFMEVGIPVATRTTAPPKLDETQQAEFIRKVKDLAPKYRTEPLKEA
jgi:hypothetical protein